MPVDRSIAALVHQREWWQPAKGDPLKLTDMSCRYKANTHAFLLRNAKTIAGRVQLQISLRYAEYEDVIGSYSMLDPQSPEGQAELVKRLGAEQWLRETPLLRELLYQSRASAFDGPVA